MDPKDIFERLKGAMLSDLVSKLNANELDLAAIEALPPGAADEDLVDAIAKAFEVSEQDLEAEYVEVAKTKGLEAPEGGLVMKRMGLDVNSKAGMAEGEAVTKGKRVKKAPADYHPDEKELAQINELSNVDLDRNSVYVFTLTSADTITDRSSDRFSTKALGSMAEMSKDKPYLRDHNWSTASVAGKIFDAKVTDKKLMQKVYVPINAKNEEIIAGMMDGTLNKVSVGFATAPQDYVCTSCNKSLYSRDCPHYPGMKDQNGNVTVGEYKDVADYFEVSNVAVPCLPAAGIRRGKGVDRINTELQGDETVDVTAKAEEQAPEVVETTTPEEVIVEAKAADPVVEATAAPEVAAEPTVEEPAAETKKSFEELALEMMSALKESVDSLKEVAADIKAAQVAKVEAEKTAEEESTEEIARKLAATSIEAGATPQDAAVKVDFTKSGWGSGVFAALTKKAPTNQ